MSSYTRRLSAEQLIGYIANDYIELSWDKKENQLQEWRRICQEWIANKYNEKYK